MLTFASALLIIGQAGSIQVPQIPHGSSMSALNVQGKWIETYFYKPWDFRRDRIILVLHGTLRNADEYRDHAIGMGERFNALIVSPKFDAERFPSRLYQRGGILNANGSAASEEDWTYNYIPKLISEVRKIEQRNIPFWVIGHSAGGQFIVRMAAFKDVGAERLVAANAGSHLFPRTDWPFGYGFGSLPASLANEDRLRNYLAAPLTLYNGTGDNKPDEYFDEGADAMKQGPGRYQRGQAVFSFAKNLAKEKGWRFNWRWVEVGGIGHDHERMFNHPQCEVALFGRRPKDWPR